MEKPLLYLVAGPTASGKTASALALAQTAPSIIINADALQVYQNLPLLTAQPAPREKAAVPHALFEIFSPHEQGSVGKWLPLAHAALDTAVRERLMPIVVGGTGLYFKALLEGLAEIPTIPQAVRDETIRLYDILGHDAFRAALAARDSESAAKIRPNDRQRLIRAYEVVTQTGTALPSWQRQGPAHKDLAQRFTLRPRLLLPDREDLYARCDARFLKMMDSGALDEVRALLAAPHPPSSSALKILGVRELASHLRGELSLDEALSNAQQATRHYAKRQVTWFKNQAPWTQADVEKISPPSFCLA